MVILSQHLWGSPSAHGLLKRLSGKVVWATSIPSGGENSDIVNVMNMLTQDTAHQIRSPPPTIT